MKKISLGVPLALAGAATVLTVCPGLRRAHTFFGVVWTALSVAHAYQYRNKMAKDFFGETAVTEFFGGAKAKAAALKQKALEKFPAPPTRLGGLIRSMRAAFYMPGRIRLYSPSFIDNEALSEQVLQVLGEYEAFDSVDINLRTGSLLLIYEPEKLRENDELRVIEDYVKTHVVRR
ncbi:hypothetical protein TAMA11512_04870 [Selenomonas sp. TAMA-11512]|uniref:HMA2 domain-containing protein n=1 Tax=Selenomonas sp. TAMA-11512 TaxID=3095337 RepID=UPI003087D211|nr:hypothetical protein TAMA11512_04870 [Selenomonas sp. TAMA-11512]